MSRQMKRFKFVISFLICFFCTGALDAMQLLDNFSPPPGLYYCSYPVYYTADKMKDHNGDTTINELDFNVFTHIFRFTYYNNTSFKNTWLWSVATPYSRIEMLDSHGAGVQDVILVTAYYLIEDTGKKNWLVSGLYVDAPFGEYDATKTVNMGMNVWKFRPFIAFAKKFGKFGLEGILKYNMYTKNDDTQAQSGSEVIVESCFEYFVKPNFVTALQLNGIFGSDSKIEGKSISNTAVQKYQTGASFYWAPGGPGIPSIVFEYLTEFGVENSTAGNQILVRFAWKIN